MNNIWNYIPLYLLLLYALGVLTQFYFSIFTGYFQGFFVTIVFFASCRLFFKRVELFVFFFLGMYALFGFQNPDGHFKKYENKTGVIHLKIHSVLKGNKYSKTYVAEVIFFDSVSCAGKVLLKIERDSATPLIEIDDFVMARARINKLPKNSNIYGFDYSDFLKKKNIQAQLFLKRKTYKVQKSNSFNLRKWSDHQRFFLKGKLRETVKNKELTGLIEAMLLGDKSQVAKDVLTNFASAGVLHILAISGLHVGLLLCLLNFICSPLLFFKKGKYIRLVLVMLSLWGFALLVGLSSSVVRAVTMFSFVGMAICLSGRITVFHSLVSSAFVLMLYNPFFIFDVGFQLSYSAVLFIVHLQPFLANLWKPRCRVLVYFWSLVTVSIAAQIGILPLSLYYFHQFPSLFLLSNLVVVPFVGLVLCFGLLALLFAVFGWSLSVFVALFSQLVLLLNRFVAWVAMQEAYLFENVYFPLPYVWASYVCIVLGIAGLKIKKKALFFIFSAIIVVFVLLHFWHIKENTSKDAFVVFHKYKSSLLLRQNQGEIEVYTNSRFKDSLFLRDYFRENYPIEKVSFSRIGNFYEFQNKKLWVMDSLWRNTGAPVKAQILVLKNSPKLNLERLLRNTEIEKVVADGSNYPSYKKRWRKTCQKLNVGYHDTSVKGAFVLK